MGSKSKGQELQEKLSVKIPNSWQTRDVSERNEVFEFCDGYKAFLDAAKTEREFVVETEKRLIENGFVNILDVMRGKKKLKVGDRVYQIYHKKAIIMAVMGETPLMEGTSILGAHIDSPRIDLKQNPIYEDTEMVLFKTHYYGGIKKYQWVTIPLSIHGVVIKENGEEVNIIIGEDEKDPVFTITDLLPHLAQEQMQKKMVDAIVGEGLNVLVGSIPFDDEKVKDKVKLNILHMLYEKYGLTEEDFVSAELEILPAFLAKDVGLDRSFIGSYGQDDRVCSYTSLMALLALQDIKKTSVVFLSDKEEIGSVGNTGAQSSIFENFMARLCYLNSEKDHDMVLRTCLENSKMLSADVNAGVDPNFEGVWDKKNASYMSKGIVLQKYTGSRGKVGGSDANPEFIAEIRSIFNAQKIPWQCAELGKVDQGGGGTIAQFMANLGITVLDCGVPILSMHSPFEVTSKVDVHSMYQAYIAFLKHAS